MTFPSLSKWRTWLSPLPRFTGGPGEITLAGTIHNSDGTGRSGMRVFGQWALVYVVSGKAHYHDDRGTTAQVEPGGWILVFPELAHSYRPAPSTCWDEIYVCFRGPIFETWRESGIYDIARPYGRWIDPKNGVAAFERFFRKVSQKDCSALKAACLWQELMEEIICSHRNPTPNSDEWLRRAQDALELMDPQQNSNSPRQVAKACGMGYESFRKKFEAATGVPPARYALSRRIERARQLLTLEPLTNGEIARILGFYDEFHFSKTFNRLTGCSPREFRKRIEKGPTPID